MLNTKKSIAKMMVSAFALSLATMGVSITAFAEETPATTTVTETSVAESEETTESTKTSEITTESSEIQLTDAEMNDLLDELSQMNSEAEIGESGIDYYADDYYDTDGNATLIKHEDIIYESEEMQFIAVTTKDGNVFYILINYSAEGDEDNVYFLNKVDDFDLYSLLYAGNESEEGQDPQERAKAYADAANSGNSVTTAVTSEEETEESTEEQPTNKSASSNNMLLIGVGAVLVIGGVAFFVAKSGKLGKKKKTAIPDDDDEYEDDFGDVDE